MPVDRINNIMTNNHKWSDIGLGKSGETYIVGADYKLRTQSRFLAEDKHKYLDVMKNLGVPAVTLKQMENTGQASGLQDEVVMMPLVGEFDDRRINQLNEALVEGIHASRARVAIIDITGVAVFNEIFAAGLRRAVAAVRLLGAQVVITGMQPDMAEGLADVGERLPGVETRPSLQDGIDLAVGHRRQSMKDNLRIMEKKL